MPPVRFEPTISAGERPQTYALDRAATGTGMILNNKFKQFRIIVKKKNGREGFSRGTVLICKDSKTDAFFLGLISNLMH